MVLLTDLDKIKTIAAQKETENEHFRRFLKQQDSEIIDNIVQQLNAGVTQAIDCTQCGNCCKSLMINVSNEELLSLATQLQTDQATVKAKYLEESEQGQLIISTIPCHFLEGNKCSIYNNRFSECREFPHLHKPHFTGRLFGTMMYFGTCPIIFNVVEELKKALKFDGEGYVE